MLSLLFSPAARNGFNVPRTPDMRKTKPARQGLTPQKRAQKSTSRSLRPLAHNRTPGAPVLKSTTAKPRPSRKRAARLPRDSSAGPKKRSRAEKQAEDDMVGSVHDPDAEHWKQHHGQPGAENCCRTCSARTLRVRASDGSVLRGFPRLGCGVPLPRARWGSRAARVPPVIKLFAMVSLGLAVSI